MTGPVPTPDLMARHKAAMKLIKHVSLGERVELLAAVVAPRSREWERLGDPNTLAVLRPREELSDDGAGGPDQVGDHHLPGP